jgi:hypothetical protein
MADVVAIADRRARGLLKSSRRQAPRARSAAAALADA